VSWVKRVNGSLALPESLVVPLPSPADLLLLEAKIIGGRDQWGGVLDGNDDDGADAAAGVRDAVGGEEADGPLLALTATSAWAAPTDQSAYRGLQHPDRAVVDRPGQQVPA
jgi:hypothetical protein